MTEPRPGDVVDGRFAILELIGQGGMASVFKAMDVETGRPVALKFPFLSFESDPVFYSRFEREIELGRTMDHPGVIRMLAVDRPSRPYAAMELLEGETLWDRLQRTRPLPVDEALSLAGLMCDALEYLQQHGTVHRDLKPTNIMLCHDGSIRVMDFGLASSSAGRRMTLMGAAGMGTMDYMAPEQLKGRPGDHRMDVFSLGAILYEMTTGRVPYDDQPDPYSMMKARLVGDPVPPRTYNPALPPQVEEIVLRALARDPADRYQTASELKRDLMAPCDVLVTGRADRLQRPNIRSRYWKLAGVIAVGVLAPIVLFLLLLAVLKG
jgi:eukaryotic-like serine/threonine-protein kinase